MRASAVACVAATLWQTCWRLGSASLPIHEYDALIGVPMVALAALTFGIVLPCSDSRRLLAPGSQV